MLCVECLFEWKLRDGDTGEPVTEGIYRVCEPLCVLCLRLAWLQISCVSERWLCCTHKKSCARLVPPCIASAHQTLFYVCLGVPRPCAWQKSSGCVRYDNWSRSIYKLPKDAALYLILFDHHRRQSWIVIVKR